MGYFFAYVASWHSGSQTVKKCVITIYGYHTRGFKILHRFTSFISFLILPVLTALLFDWKEFQKKVDSFIEDSLNFVVFANLAHCARHLFAFNVIKQRSMCFNTFSFAKVLGLLGTLSSSN